MTGKNVWLILALLLTSAKLAHAAVTGNIEGIVVDGEHKKPLPGVTVSVSGPALQGEQIEFTDQRGHYLITELPPGEYVVRFYFGEVKVERVGIVLNADKTLQVNGVIPLNATTLKTYRITEKAPTVDVANAQVQTQITGEMVRNAPVAGGFQGRRNYDSVLGLVPGASFDVNPNFSGSVGNENTFLIDGINTTQVNQGFLGTQMTVEFVRETEVVTAGYNAEYGRATGAVVNVVTKSGSNEFHGGAWFFALPLQLTPPTLAGNGEAIASTTKRQYAFDFGADLGGPIVKDRIWFYIGVAPSLSRDTITEMVQMRLATNLDPNMMMGSYAGDVVGGVPACPRYLASSQLCPGTNLFKFATQVLPQYTTRTTYDRALYNWIAKLDFRLSQNANLSVSYIGSPTTQGGIGGGAADVTARSSSDLDNIHDVGAHFTAKVLNRQLQLDALIGWHWEHYQQYYPAGGEQERLTYRGTLPLTTFQNVPECATQMVHGVAFNPCPITGYVVGGMGGQLYQTTQRISATASATYFLKAAGTHALKAGFEFEDASFENRPFYTSGAIARVSTAGTVQQRVYASVDGMGNVTVQPNGIDGTTSTFNEAAYLRDSWNVGFIRGLTVNAGLRWEAQQAHAGDGSTVIAIWDNLAPRVGFAYDVTRRGASKLFANYGRYYETLPLNINDSQFTNRGFSNYIAAMPGTCMRDMNGQVMLGTCAFRPLTAADINTSTYAKVQPGIQGQYLNEFVVGFQYDVGLDLVLGAAYIHRDLGRVIEDSSPDGSGNFIIGNPGADQSAAVDDLRKRIAKTTDPMKLKDLQYTLQQVQGLATMPTPKRDYNALQLTAQKRLSHNFILLASYTYSRTLGNYAQSLGAPNTSSLYDYRELMVNTEGPLPTDRPHNFKFSGGYRLPLGRNSLNIGLGVTVQSGAPIDVLGVDSHYGSSIIFILPRGSGGRLPPVASIDLHFGYGRDFGHHTRMEVTLDVFNVANFQQVTSVDQTYTTNVVDPIAGGVVADLKNLRTTAGAPVVLNPNYGQPTGYQAPLSLRVGARALF